MFDVGTTVIIAIIIMMLPRLPTGTKYLQESEKKKKKKDRTEKLTLDQRCLP